MWEQTYDVDSESMVCTKCDTKFSTEIEHKQHHREEHKAVNDKYSNESL